MPTDTSVNTAIINILTRQQYDAATKSNTEFYAITDEDTLPSQTGQSGKFLTTDGSSASWAAVPTGGALPDQTGHSGEFLTTNGTTASWGDAGANKDLSNLTDAGNIVSAHASMPSNTYDNLTIGASGTSYTAPADGWFWLGGIADNVSENTKAVMRRASDRFGVSFGTQGEFFTGGWCGGILPVKKGDAVVLFHINITADHALRFYYAEGSKSEHV